MTSPVPPTNNQQNIPLKKKDIVFSGIQPSGKLTLGNYLGAIKNWIPLQDQYECLFCIVDLHAITVPQDPFALRKAKYEVAALYLASGISPLKSTLFAQSQVSQHAELAWLLNCLTPLGWLNRMTQFKDKAGKHREQACLGLYGYPVLMAADILIHKAQFVPVGEDQRQHLELARDIAHTFNQKYQADFFPLPSAMNSIVPRVMSLRDGTKKMSKSDPSDFSCIYMLDTEEEIQLKIRKAKTDPEALPSELKDLDHRPEARNLIAIYAALSGQTNQETLESFSGASFSTFKPALADLIIESLKPIRQETLKLLAFPDYLEDQLRKGRDLVQQKAVITLQEVYKLMGLL